jgi:hypothetical protein
MRVLSDRVEYFILLEGRGDESIPPALSGSIWAWDGRQLNVPRFVKLILGMDIPGPKSCIWVRRSDINTARLLSPDGNSKVRNRVWVGVSKGYPEDC